MEEIEVRETFGALQEVFKFSDGGSAQVTCLECVKTGCVRVYC
jgi:hypothetical protein